MRSRRLASYMEQLERRLREARQVGNDSTFSFAKDAVASVERDRVPDTEVSAAPSSRPRGPDVSWQEGGPTGMSRAILDKLLDAYPEGMTARQLMASLRDRDDPLWTVTGTSVNRRLYGRLKEWLRKEGQTPPRWFLRSAAGEDEPEVPRGSQEPAGSESARDRAESDRRPSREFGRPLRVEVSDDQASAEQGTSEERYEICDVCVLQKPAETMIRVGGENICERCYREMKASSP